MGTPSLLSPTTSEELGVCRWEGMRHFKAPVILIMEKYKLGSTSVSPSNVSQLHPAPPPTSATAIWEDEKSWNGDWSHQKGRGLGGVL